MNNRDIIFVWIPKNAGSTVAATLNGSLGLKKKNTHPKSVSGSYTFGVITKSTSFQRIYLKSYVHNAFKF